MANRFSIQFIVYAGSMNTTSYTYPFWFVCALFLGSVVFNALYRKYTKWLLGGLGVYLLLWYGFLHTVHIPMLPWSAEVVPFVLVYFLVGIYINSFFDNLNSVWQVAIYSVSIILAIGMIISEYYGLFNFKLSMKNLSMHNFLLDIMIPITFFIALKRICLYICDMRHLQILLSYIGQSSLVIMFTHTATFSLFRHVDIANTFVLFLLRIIIAIALGVTIYTICKKINSYQSYFWVKNNDNSLYLS